MRGLCSFLLLAPLAPLTALAAAPGSRARDAAATWVAS